MLEGMFQGIERSNTLKDKAPLETDCKDANIRTKKFCQQKEISYIDNSIFFYIFITYNLHRKIKLIITKYLKLVYRGIKWTNKKDNKKWLGTGLQNKA